MGGLNSENLFLTVLEDEMSKIKVPADWVPGEGSLSGLQGYLLFLSSHGGEKKEASSSVYLIPSRVHLNLITSQRAHLQMPSHWGLGIQHIHFRGRAIQFSPKQCERNINISVAMLIAEIPSKPQSCRWHISGYLGHPLPESAWVSFRNRFLLVLFFFLSLLYTDNFI